MSALAKGKGTCPSLVGVSILVVDDVAENRFIAESFLRAEGATTETAEDGREALDKIEHGSYDLIIMDIQMPVLDGTTATKILRGWGFAKPILAVTASHLEHIQQIESEGCFNQVIRKPIRRADFVSTVCGFLRLSRPSEPVPQETPGSL